MSEDKGVGLKDESHWHFDMSVWSTQEDGNAHTAAVAPSQFGLCSTALVEGEERWIGGKLVWNSLLNCT